MAKKRRKQAAGWEAKLRPMQEVAAMLKEVMLQYDTANFTAKKKLDERARALAWVLSNPRVKTLVFNEEELAILECLY
jgi:hypothetical protein